MSMVDIHYRLPMTVVTVSGRRTYTTNEVAGPGETVVRESAIAIEIVADPLSDQRLTVPEAANGKTSMTIDIAPDGRLIGVNSTSEGQSSERLKAALQLGFYSAGAAAPFVAPLGLAGAAIAATIGVGVGGLVSLSGSARGAVPGRAFLTADPMDADEPEATKSRELSVAQAAGVGIHAKYLKEHRAQAEIFYGLLRSEHELQHQIAWSIMGSSANDIRTISRSLATVRAELSRARSLYSTWVESKSVIKQADILRRVFRVDQLPNSKALHESAARGFLPKDGPWAALFRDLRAAVSCDLDPAQDGSKVDLKDNPVIIYRRPQLATFTTWRIEKDGSGKYTLISDKVERKVVALRGSEASVALDHGSNDVCQCRVQRRRDSQSSGYHADGRVNQASASVGRSSRHRQGRIRCGVGCG